MEIERGWKMYIEIQQLKEMGLNISQISRRLGISRPTVYEYINMTPGEFNKRIEKMRERRKKPDQYHDEILNWLLEYPDLSGTQIYDWLEERLGKLDFSDLPIIAHSTIWINGMKILFLGLLGVETARYMAPQKENRPKYF